MQNIGKLFLKGLMTVLPIGLTLYLVYWMAATAESILGGLIRFVLDSLGVDSGFYITGMGVVLGFLLILGIGILLQIWLFRSLISLGEKILEQIPGIKSIYGSIRDLVGFFDPSKQQDFNKTVMVSVTDDNMRLMGLVTRETFDDLPDGVGGPDVVAVYLPMSYQLGGFTVMVPKEKVEPVDMKVDEAMQFVLTAGVSSTKGDA